MDVEGHIRPGDDSEVLNTQLERLPTCCSL